MQIQMQKEDGHMMTQAEAGAGAPELSVVGEWKFPPGRFLSEERTTAQLPLC